ncbi:MAG: hypothetical protein ACK4UN_06005, partial [Limisphaerales bacterium]
MFAPQLYFDRRTKARCLTRLLLVLALFSFTRTAEAEAFFLQEGSVHAFNGKSRRPVALSAQARGGKKEDLIKIYDTSKGRSGNHFLVSTQRDSRYIPNTDSPSGWDLWLQEESGPGRSISASAFRARFCPEGKRIAYTTTDCVLHVEDLQGKKLREVANAYNPHWRRDGKMILFEKVPEGRYLYHPETLHIARLDLASGEVKLLTDASFDDVRPEFHPSGEWILFVSGGRTGLASFWQVGAEGGEPSQLTNVG